MSYVDIAIIAIVALFALIGLWKGLGKTVVKLVCFAGALIITYFAASYVINWLLGVEFLRGFIIGDGFSLRALYYGAIGGEAFSGADSVSGAMSLFVQPIVERYSALNIEEIYSMTVAEFTAVSLAFNTLSIILCIVIYLIARLLCSILGWILGKIILHGDAKIVGRLIGFVLGGARGFAWAMILIIMSTIIMPFGWAQPYSETIKNSMLGNTTASLAYKTYDSVLFGTNDTDKAVKLLESAGYVPLTFEQKQAKAESNLVNYRASLEANNSYSDKGRAQLDTALNAAKTAVVNATDNQSLKQALEDGKKMLDDVATKDQESKIDALTSFYEGISAGREGTVLEQLESVYLLGVKAIKDANDSASIDLAFENCKTQMNGVIGA